VHELERAFQAHLVRGDIRPAARARRVGEWNDRDALELVTAADAVGQAPGQTEEPLQREAADRDDEARAEQLELPVAPELAELLLARRRCPVAASGRSTPGIAACDRGAEERRVEGLFVEREPAAKRLASAAAPRQALFALDDAGSLSIHIRALCGERRTNWKRLEREARLDAGAAPRSVALHGGNGPVRRPADGHRG
jgi:hypothetical protein